MNIAKTSNQSVDRNFCRGVILQYVHFFVWVRNPLIDLTINFRCFDSGRSYDFNELPITGQEGNI